MSIGLMIIGFIVFWPLGLAMLAWIIWGDRMKSAWAQHKPQVAENLRSAGFTRPDFGRTGNTAFDEYRERELKRLEEERASIEKMREDFDAFLRTLRKAKDQEEFDRFMSDHKRPAS